MALELTISSTKERYEYYRKSGVSAAEAIDQAF